MELAALLTALWALSVFDGAVLLASCLLGWMLLALAVCDARSYLLPDALTLSLLLMGLGATYWLQPDALDEHAVAATLGYVVFRGIDMGYFWLRGRHGLGQGDAKLLAAAGAWLGLEALPQVVLIAAVIGLLLAAVMAWRGQRVRAQMRLPFGPPLALATWLVWLYF
jgi:leader peptidase (prepilin peptidase)/N-methyltransferase